MIITLTPEQKDLFRQLQNKTSASTDLVTRILQLKLLDGKTHAQIASELGYSKSYVDNLHSQAKRQFQQDAKL